MDRKELAAAIAGDAGCDQAQAERMLASLVRRTMQAVKKGEQVALLGFGTFDRVQRARRVARNPRTGESVKVPARKAPTFRPGATFKGVVAGEKPLPAMPGGRSRSGSASGSGSGSGTMRKAAASAPSRSSGSRPSPASRPGDTRSKAGGRSGSVRAGSAGSMRRGSRTRS